MICSVIFACQQRLVYFFQGFALPFRSVTQKPKFSSHLRNVCKRPGYKSCENRKTGHSSVQCVTKAVRISYHHRRASSKLGVSSIPLMLINWFVFLRVLVLYISELVTVFACVIYRVCARVRVHVRVRLHLCVCIGCQMSDESQIMITITDGVPFPSDQAEGPAVQFADSDAARQNKNLTRMAIRMSESYLCHTRHLVHTRKETLTQSRTKRTRKLRRT